jgi:2,4-dienoyl-CoA reductase-like NADH-dependent reductase (Old Yellow Enzyme family)
MINLSPTGPGNIRLHLPKTHFGDPCPLSKEGIVDVIRRFVYAASICKQCGFDGVQVGLDWHCFN